MMQRAYFLSGLPCSLPDACMVMKLCTTTGLKHTLQTSNHSPCWSKGVPRENTIQGRHFLSAPCKFRLFPFQLRIPRLLCNLVKMPGRQGTLQCASHLSWVHQYIMQGLTVCLLNGTLCDMCVSLGTGGKVKQLKQPKKDRPELEDVSLGNCVAMYVSDLYQLLCPSLCPTMGQSWRCD